MNNIATHETERPAVFWVRSPIIRKMVYPKRDGFIVAHVEGPTAQWFGFDFYLAGVCTNLPRYDGDHCPPKHPGARNQ